MSDSKISRRKLLKLAATSVAAVPFESTFGFGRGELVRIPPQKKHTAEWLSQLTARGKPSIFSGKSLANIGMPIGGIGSGQVYLGGDGRLWHWDIFNQFGESDMGEIRNGLHYKTPLKPESPFEMGFYASINGRSLPLELEEWPDCSFQGRYPIGDVNYGVQHGAQIQLEAYSPFIPLDVDNSEYPAVFMSYRVTNRSNQPLLVEMVGWMDNPCCLGSRAQRSVELATDIRSETGWRFFLHSVKEATSSQPTRPEIIFADFESKTYGNWKVEGSAFGEGPVEIAKIPAYQGNVNGMGLRVVNSHHTRKGEDVVAADVHVGKLISPPFEINRNFVTFLVGGGNHPGKTCVNLIVDGKVVRSTPGKNSNRMEPAFWNVHEFAGKSAHIEVIDNVAGAWGNIGVDQIMLVDKVKQLDLRDENDFGTIGMGVVGEGAENAPQSWPEFRKSLNCANPSAVSSTHIIQPGDSRLYEFIVSWHFPNVNRAAMANLQRRDVFKRHYSVRFKDAFDVFSAVRKQRFALQAQTKSWTNTWYDSTLPYWFLDRTMANTSILSTSTCYRFDDGRFYGWEGIYCCPGTCTHVWQYAQAVGRLFPELERDTRARVDYGIAYHENGSLGHRAEVWQDAATDGQCGTILRVYREHQTSRDSSWLKKLWPKVKKSIEFMIAQDPNQDGVLEGGQPNTLDAVWYGKIAWISSLYVATLRAGEAMAKDMEDLEFATLCGRIAAAGSETIQRDLFNGDYYIQRPDPKFPKAINTNDGCHIDQVFGQSWAYQVGLPRVLPAPETKKALSSLYKYNFVPDVGTYREKSKIKGGRWYALPGESGLLMCTWPKGGAEKAGGEGNEAWAVGYFNECMTGFEHQVAGHMLWEGLIEEGLAIEKTIHERYDASRRNPYNEIECSDHYARAMASYGVFLAACGFQYHGPNQSIAFDPKIKPDQFRAAFTAASGWGTYEQTTKEGSMSVRLTVKYGTLSIKQLGFRCPTPWQDVIVTLEKRQFAFKTSLHPDGMTWIELDASTTIKAGEQIALKIAPAKVGVQLAT